MKAMIKNMTVIAILATGLAAVPAQAAQSEHQRYLIQKAMKAKQEAKQQQQAKVEEQKVCDKSAEASSEAQQTSH